MINTWNLYQAEVNIMFSRFASFIEVGGGESALVSFLHYWALGHFIDLANYLGREEDVQTYTAMRENLHGVCNDKLWDEQWFIRGVTKNGKKSERLQIKRAEYIWNPMRGQCSRVRQTLKKAVWRCGPDRCDR